MDTSAPSAHLNPVIDLFEADKPAFTMWVNYYGVGADYQTAASLQANPAYDFLLYDLEHQPYDVGQLRRFLWDLIDPATLAAHGRRALTPVIVRIPPSGREMNEWVVKQVLDAGVAGLMFPHIETPEQALAAVAASRYPARSDAAHPEPAGRRGYSPAVPVRYWGVDHDEYVRASDVWGLSPEGNLLLVFIIESRLGVENVHRIAEALSSTGVRCVLWAGGGDMSISYGEPPFGGDQTETIKGVEAVLAAGREFGLPVGLNSYADIEGMYAKGARAFFTLGPAAIASDPVPAEVRAALRG